MTSPTTKLDTALDILKKLNIDDRKIFESAAALSRWLDSGAKLPVLPFRLPLDPIIGLIPVVGDILPFALGLTIVGAAHRLGVPAQLRRKMLRNLVFDAAIGVVPIVGDIADFFFKANAYNLRLIEDHLRERDQSSRP